METKELLKKVRHIEIKTRRLSDSLFSGEYHSSFKGRGMAFSEVRRYEVGDDIRTIDWNVTAKLNDPYIKVFEEERELNMVMVVDVSASGSFGTRERKKREMIAEIAATLAFSALKNNDKVGILFVSDQVEKFIPPAKGRTHVLRLIREILELKPQNTATSLRVGIETVMRAIKKKSIVFVLSDFLDEGYQRALNVAARKHDITGIRVYDRAEKEMPDIGLLPVKDAETGVTRWVDNSSSRVRESHYRWFRSCEERFRRNFQNAGAGRLSVRTDQSYVKKLLQYFKQRH